MTTPSRGLCSVPLLLGMLVSYWCAAADAGAGKPILILGDSLSAGYGIALEQSWPALLEQRLRREGYPYRVVNASVSGETTAGGARRIAALLAEHAPAVVVIALGANDGLRGLDPAVVKQNLTTIVAAAAQTGALALLLQVRIPPNYGPQYTEKFEAVFADFAMYPQLMLAPFMLERFALNQSAFQTDGLHPTAAVQPQIVETLWPSLAAALAAVGAQAGVQ